MKLLAIIFSSFAFLGLVGCSSQPASSSCCASNETASRAPAAKPSAVSAPRTHKLHLYAK